MGLTDVKNALLLPPNILNAQICMECLNYLSIGPVMITKDNKTICGRCLKMCEGLDGLTTSFYNKAAEACVFSCINHYDGCNTILYFNEALKHESTCIGKTYRCTTCSYQGNSYQFIQHCKRNHAQLFFTGGVFRLNLSSNCNKDLLYCDIHHIFLISVTLKDGILKAAVKILNIPPDRSETMRYKLRFFKDDARTLYQTENLQYLSNKNKWARNIWHTINVKDLLQISSTEISCEFNAVLDTATDLEEKDYNMKHRYFKWEENVREREYMIKVEEEKLELEKKSLNNPYSVIKNIIKLYYRSSFNCVNCNTVIADKLFISVCPQGHVSCPNCLKSYCSACKTNCEWINCKTLLQDLELSCDWQNCVVKLKIDKFVFHQQVCKHRRYKCPLEDCNFTGIEEELVSHWHSDVSSLKVGKTVDFKTKESTVIFWITEYVHELLHVTVTKQTNGNVYLRVSEAFAIFPNNYSIQLRYFYPSSNRYEVLADLVQSGGSKIYSSNISGYPDWRLVINLK